MKTAKCGCRFATLIVLASISSACQKTDIAAGCPGLHSFEVSSAELDATHAVHSGNLKLLGVRGYAVEIPGFPDVKMAREKYGVSIIEGTSDAIANETCRGLIDQAQIYAKNYNLAVVKLHPRN